MANNALGTETSSPLASAPGSEHHRPPMGILGGNRGQLDRDREMLTSTSQYQVKILLNKCNIKRVCAHHQLHIEIFNAHVCIIEHKVCFHNTP